VLGQRGQLPGRSVERRRHRSHRRAPEPWRSGHGGDRRSNGGSGPPADDPTTSGLGLQSARHRGGRSPAATADPTEAAERTSRSSNGGELRTPIGRGRNSLVDHPAARWSRRSVGVWWARLAARSRSSSSTCGQSAQPAARRYRPYPALARGPH
jgi:hypothetical protein